MNDATGVRVAQRLSDRDHQQCCREPDRNQPQQVEPAVAADADPWSDPVDRRNRARESRRINDLLAHRQLIPKARGRVEGRRTGGLL